MRGKESSRSMGTDQSRITPACAGKSSIPEGQNQAEGDHPRVCGEKSTRIAPKNCGSWITPACAGKRMCITTWDSQNRDHPRVCGEKVPCADGCGPLKGSPPRVRGKAGGSSGVCLIMGITPACAGKSSSAGSVWQSSRDHPRVCGEKRNAKHVQCYYVGSPPRVRGKEGQERDDFAMVRITPACAGKSP